MAFYCFSTYQFWLAVRNQDNPSKFENIQTKILLTISKNINIIRNPLSLVAIINKLTSEHRHIRIYAYLTLQIDPL